MTNKNATPAPLVLFLAHMLILLACWTLVIKFIFPLIFDFAYGHRAGEHIMWDFWWVIHLWLAWALLKWPRYTPSLAVAVSVVEIIIIVVKFWFFLSAPQWDLWRTNWFINKVFVIACFIIMLVYFALNWNNLKQKH